MIKRSFILSLVLLANISFARPDAVQLLQNMTRSARLNNYQANLVLAEDNKLTSFMIEHRASSGGAREWERMVSLQGVKQEAVVDNVRMLLLLPNGKRDIVLRNPLADTFLNLQNSLQKYTVNFIGEDRVAGRPSYVLHIKAKDEYHYSYLLWLDKETGIYMRAQWLDKNDKIKSEAMFTSIKFKRIQNNLAEAGVFASSSAVASTSSANKEITIDSSMIDIGWLPENFSLVNKLTYPPEGPGQTEHLIFGDGTVRVSVYIDMTNESAIQGPIDLGRTSGFSLDVADKHITVLGEMPSLTLKKIAKSIVRK